jgi:uncharacterized protein
MRARSAARDSVRGAQGQDQQARPVGPAEREPILDVLRGFALLGILLVNVEYLRSADLYLVMAGDARPEVGTVERALSFAVGWLVAGKFIASFAILFGVGAALIAARARRRGVAPARLLARRFAWLALLGLAHMVLVFPGDILFIYGLTGMALLAFLRASAATALRWAGGLLALVVAASAALAGLTSLLAPPGPDSPLAAGMSGFLHERGEAAVEAFTAGSYADVVTAHIWEAALIQGGQLLTVPWILALVVFGFAVGRAGVVADLRAHRRGLRLAAGAGLGLGLPASLAVGALGPMAMGAVLSPSAGSSAMAVLSAVGVTLGAPLLAVGYLSALALWCLRMGPIRPLENLGRVALSAYLLQNLLALGVFAGLGWYARVSAVGGLGVVLAIWACLLLSAPLWLRWFSYGPVEWLWRAATYGGRPALRRR